MAEFSVQRKGDSDWMMMMIRQPAEVTPEPAEQTAREVAAAKQLPARGSFGWNASPGGHAVRVLHLGPYSAEGPTIAALHGFIHAQGRSFDGRRHQHHEIDLGDPRRTAPERPRTIIRQPVSPA